MSVSFDGIDLRLARADEHLGVIEREVAKVAGKNRRVVGEFEANSFEYVFRIEGELPPPEIGVYVSEAVHHLRSALDNLVWQIVLGRRNQPTRFNAFPIEETDGQFNAAEKRGALAGTDADDRAFIEQAQPYHHGPHWKRRHLLLLLKNLSNIDKHRYMHAGFVAMTLSGPGGIPLPLSPDLGAMLKALPPDGSTPELRGLCVVVGVNVKVTGWRFTAGEQRDDRAELLRATLVDPPPHPEVKLQPNPAIDVSLTNIEGRDEQPVTVSDLRRIQRRVNEIVGHFRLLF